MKLNKEYNNKIEETVYCGRHESGVRIIIMPKDGYQKTYALFATDFGSTNNKFSVNKGNVISVPDGIAHFLEHKLFEQPDETNIFDEYAKYGASANAFTSFDVTAYLFQCTEHFEENFRILLNFVQEPYFTVENVAKEQGIIGQEIRMYDDDPEWQTTMNFLKAMYHSYPLNIDIAGTVESISSITKDTLYECYNAFYNPNNMAICVVGNVDPLKVCAIADECIRDVPKKEITPLFDNEPKTVRQNEIVSKLSVSIPLFSMGFKDTDIGYGGKELLKKSIEMAILLEMFIGKSSALYKKIYEEGLINESFYDEYEFNIDYAHSSFSGESSDPYRLCEIFKNAVIEYKPTEEAFVRIKKVIWGEEVGHYNSIERIAHTILYDTFKDIAPFDFFEVYDTVTFEDIQNRWNNHFDLSRLVLSVVEA